MKLYETVAMVELYWLIKKSTCKIEVIRQFSGPIKTEFK